MNKIIFWLVPVAALLGALTAYRGLSVPVSLEKQDSAPPQPLSTSPPAQVTAVAAALLATSEPDPEIQAQLQTYLTQLSQQGFASSDQGIWVQNHAQLLTSHQGSTPLPAASLTKVATSLALLHTFGPNHRFITEIGITGAIEAGVVQGDLVVSGGADPFFVWEEAVAVANRLQERGIRQINGNLVIQGKFYMNFFSDPQQAGQLLRQGLNAQIWPPEAETQFQSLPSGTPRPQIAIQGAVVAATQTPTDRQPLLRHSSQPLVELIKKMNRYSNNLMADMLAAEVGGPAVVAAQVAEITGLPAQEIQLINGSGLGVENRLSPRAATALFIHLAELLQAHDLTVADAFEVVGVDDGVLEKRLLPSPLVAKSGTLNQVSTLAGALPTQDQGIVWFAIMNTGSDVEGARVQQGQLLKLWVNRWQPVFTLPETLTPTLALTRDSQQEWR
jgi:D-alanyl-D-alanine carboxypeptidase/D-alanyl-D-alanine-endopeptidase (penicillin-binding protein 4)